MTPLELQTRRVLEESLTRIDARTRSRLNQARQAAVAAAAQPAHLAWLQRLFSRQALVPATGAAAVAALAAVLMLGSGHHVTSTVADNPANALDVLDLVTDDDAMKLMQEDSSFYEWAAAAQEDPEPAAGGTTS